MRRFSVYLNEAQIQALTSTPNGLALASNPKRSVSEAIREVIDFQFGLKSAPKARKRTKLFSFQGLGGTWCEWRIPLSIVRKLEEIVETGHWIDAVKLLRAEFTQPDGSSYGLFEVKTCVDMIRFPK
jgi:hypothetical protein